MQLSMVPEQNEGDADDAAVSDGEEILVDANLARVLYTAYTAPAQFTEFLEGRESSGEPAAQGSLGYTTCIDALNATVELETLKPPPTNHKSMEFDMTLPVPNTIGEAKASPNWDVENGYKMAVEKECGSWVHHEVLRNAEQVPEDFRRSNLGRSSAF